MKTSILISIILTFTSLVWSMEQDQNQSQSLTQEMEFLPYEFDLIVTRLVSELPAYKKNQQKAEINRNFSSFFEFLKKNPKFVNITIGEYPGPFDYLISRLGFAENPYETELFFTLMGELLIE